ncbi:hypothetical protein H0H92_006752, partial [Tricholoma furcatifolium]
KYNSTVAGPSKALPLQKNPLYLLRHLPAARPPESPNRMHPQPCLKTRVLSSMGAESEGAIALMEFLPEEALLHSYLTDKLDMVGMMALNEG